MKDEKQEYFSMADVAKRYDVDKSTVSRWIKDGYLPGTIKKGPYPNSPSIIPQSALDYLDETRMSG